MRMLYGIVGITLLVIAGCENGGLTNNTNNQSDSDNSAVNERDADGNHATPFDQSNSEEATELVAKIRSEVLKIEDLSTNGQNIKIITNESKVVLRGPVASDAERDAIVKVVNDIAGESNVTNNLEVDADNLEVEAE